MSIYLFVKEFLEVLLEGERVNGSTYLLSKSGNDGPKRSRRRPTEIT